MKSAELDEIAMKSAELDEIAMKKKADATVESELGFYEVGDGGGQAFLLVHIIWPMNEDANKILRNDGSCPVYDQVLSKSLIMKPVDINPSDEWVNMAMAGISPRHMIKSAYRSAAFYMGQKDLEMQLKFNKIAARSKCEAMQEKFQEKLEQAYTSW